MSMEFAISILQIFLPLIAFAIVIFCCTSICKAFYRARRERNEAQLQPRAMPSVYIVPLSPSSDELRSPPPLPHHSMSEQYGPPPSYEELEIKPDFIHTFAPPAYSEIETGMGTNSETETRTESSPSSSRLVTAPEL